MEYNMQKQNYGLDAPNIVRNLLIISGIFVVLLLICFVIQQEYLFINTIVKLCLTLFLFSSLIPSNMAAIASSRYFKIKNRDKLIKQLNLTGNEVVLDVGCGRGLYTIGFTKSLKNGKVYGIDIWNPEDISANSESMIMDNIRKSGLEERICLKTEDMRQMSFESGSFDIVVASFSIHNINNVEERMKALSEISRVTKKSGRVVIIDFTKTKEYKEYYSSSGFILEKRILRLVFFQLLKILYLKNFNAPNKYDSSLPDGCLAYALGYKTSAPENHPADGDGQAGYVVKNCK